MGNKNESEKSKGISDTNTACYLKSGKLEKGRILTEFVENSGYNRKSAIQLLHSRSTSKGIQEETGAKAKIHRRNHSQIRETV